MTSVSCAQIIKSPADAIYAAFVEPSLLTTYWLDSASEPLAVDREVRWTFRVPGSSETTTATALEPGKRVAWTWSDGTTVDVKITAREAECVVRIEIGVDGDAAAAANAVEGFTVVLCDLKLLLETGRSPGLVSEKARLIATST